MSLTVRELYQHDVLTGAIQADDGQQPVIDLLDHLILALQQAGETLSQPTWWSRLRTKPGTPAHYPVVPGLYLWGSVGRGKTYLMDRFFAAVPLSKKRRYHFHHFMQQMHAALQQHQGQVNPLEKVADELAQQVRLLCFDEMFVQDITDAMILGGLFDALLKRGICIVMTSNIACQHLYENGLQRVRFLPAIALLQQHLQHWELGAGNDHRLRQLQQAQLYHFPITPAAEQQVQQMFAQLCPQPLQTGGVYQLLDRDVPVLAVGTEVIWFSFAVLCQTARSAADYIELARYFHSVIISHVPVLTQADDDATRRFVHLVDTFYDRRVKLILLAQSSIADLYQGQQLSFEFARTRSRLIEMQSSDYLALAHQPL
jgi:cell division protein ZapE